MGILTSLATDYRYTCDYLPLNAVNCPCCRCQLLDWVVLAFFARSVHIGVLKRYFPWILAPCEALKLPHIQVYSNTYEASLPTCSFMTFNWNLYTWHNAKLANKLQKRFDAFHQFCFFPLFGKPMEVPCCVLQFLTAPFQDLGSKLWLKNHLPVGWFDMWF